MPDNNQNRDYRNQDFYGAANQGNNFGARNNNVGQVQPGTPPYGEPRRYDGSSQQPYQSSLVYPAYNKPQTPPPQNNQPYPGGYSSPNPNNQAFPGYAGLKPPPQNSAPRTNPTLVNPYGGSAKKMYGGSAYNEGDTVYEALNSKKRGKSVILIISIILLLAALGIGAYFLFFKGKGSGSSSDNKKTVPAAATEADTSAVTTYATEAPTEEETESPVTAGLVETPDVVGLNMRISKVKLEEMGFRVKFNTTYSDIIEADDVISQNIAPLTKVPIDTEITLTISKGPEPEKMVEVPSVKDLPYSEASDKLIGLGFSVELEFLNSSSVQKDRVISQSVPSGTQASKGSKIILVVSQGNESTSVRYGTVNTEETALNIRKSPSTDAEIIGGADKGAKVTIIGEEGGWYIIKYKDVTGYVSKDYIKLA